MLVLFDMDGVVADFESGHAAMCKRLNIPAAMVGVGRNTWDILGNIPDEALRLRVLEGWHAPNFFADLKPIWEMIDVVRSVRNAGHSVFFCTSPLRNHATCASEKIKWVARYFGAEYENKVIISSDKTLVMGDYLVDDRPDIHGVKEPLWQHLLFAQPYNASATKRRYSLSDLVHFFTKELNTP